MRVIGQCIRKQEYQCNFYEFRRLKQDPAYANPIAGAARLFPTNRSAARIPRLRSAMGMLRMRKILGLRIKISINNIPTKPMPNIISW